MKNNFDEIYTNEEPSFFTRNGLRITRNMDSQRDYIISGNLASLLWDITWNVHSYLGFGFSSSEPEKQTKEVILNKLIFLNGALSDMYHKELIQMPPIIQETYWKLIELKKWKMEEYNDNLTKDEIDLLIKSLDEKLKQKYYNSQSQA